MTPNNRARAEQDIEAMLRAYMQRQDIASVEDIADHLRVMQAVIARELKKLEDA